MVYRAVNRSREYYHALQENPLSGLRSKNNGTNWPFNVRSSSMDVGSRSLDIGCSSNDSQTHVQILVGSSSNNYNITFIIHNYKQYN